MTMLMHHMLRAAAGYAAPTPPATDPQFNYVTMLLHGDGTNGAQNNTFVDSSTNNFTITRNGTPTQGSFSPYGNLWSNNFNGTNQYITAPAGTAFNLGSGNFTAECWVYLTSFASGVRVFGQTDSSGTSGSTSILMDITSGVVTGYMGYSSTPNSFISCTGSATITTNAWHHLAMVRNGSEFRVYVNGAQGASSNVSGLTVSSSAEPFTIGRNGSFNGLYVPGYVSNMRLVKGTAVYTSAFTPSTTPLTAVSGTSLLTCQSNRFRDNSSNNFAINVTGAPSVQRFSPFDPAAEYSTSVIGGSGYFGTSGQSVQAASNAAFTFGTGDFTVEYFVYATSWSSSPTIVDLRSSNPSSGGYADYYSTAGKFNLYWGTTTVYTSAATLGLNQWHHIAVSRSGSTVRVFVNGVLDGTFTNAFNFTDSNCRIGANTNATPAGIVGYLSDTRIVKGTAVYTSAFTPPTAPLTAITNTSLLLNTVNAGIFDNAMTNDLVTVGNAQVSTAVKKYGTGSMKFDGTGDYLTATNTLPFVFGTGDWTIETWVYFSDVTASRNIYESRATTEANRPVIYVWNGTIRYFNGSADVITSSTVSTGQWYHLAVCKSSGSTRMFINGIQTGSTYTDSITYGVGAGRPLIGAYNATSGFFSGYLDDLRITKGYARYTANFTPPTAAFPNN